MIRGLFVAFFPACAIWAVVVLIGYALTGCASAAPRVETVTVSAPVARSCVPVTLGPLPAYIDTDAALKAAGGPEDRYQMVTAGRAQRVARLGEVEPVLQGCR